MRPRPRQRARLCHHSSTRQFGMERGASHSPCAACALAAAPTEALARPSPSAAQLPQSIAGRSAAQRPHVPYTRPATADAPGSLPPPLRFPRFEAASPKAHHSHMPSGSTPARAAARTSLAAAQSPAPPGTAAGAYTASSVSGARSSPSPRSYDSRIRASSAVLRARRSARRRSAPAVSPAPSVASRRSLSARVRAITARYSLV